MNAVATRNDWPAPAVVPADGAAAVDKPRGSVLDVSRPRTRETFWKALLEWFEAAALVWLAVVALIAVGIPLVLLVRAIVNALSWVVGRIG